MVTWPKSNTIDFQAKGGTGAVANKKNCVVNVTMCVVKPPLDGGVSFTERVSAVEAIIENAGLHIRGRVCRCFPSNMVSELYRDHKDWEHFPWLVGHMTSGIAAALLVEGKDAARRMRELAGPTYPEIAREKCPNSIRALLSDPDETRDRSINEERVVDNVVHTPNPDEEGAVEREVSIFFPAVFVKSL